MTTLTKQMREDIVNSVIAGTTLPDERKAIEEDVSLTAMHAMLAKQPKEFLALVEGQPLDWFKMDAGLWVNNSNPLNKLDADRWTSKIEYPRSIAVAVQWNPNKEECEEIFREYNIRAAAWAEKNEKARGELMTFLLSQRTVEKLLAAMPELEPHILTKVTKTYALVAPSNVLSTLTKLGFDRSRVAATA